MLSRPAVCRLWFTGHLLSIVLCAQTVEPGFSYESVVTGLNAASTMAFAPDGRLFVLERRLGQVLVVEDGQLQAQPWFSVGYTSAPPSESGLLGIAFDPAFATNRYVYLFYTSPGGQEDLIVRLVDSNGTGTQHTILTPPGALPVGSTHVHHGGAMTFGPDGRLYVSTGDGGTNQNAQNPSSWLGKILRFAAPDLSIPADNPTAGSPVWAMGLRNTYGIAWHPEQQWLLGCENGAPVADEINRLLPGGNYGWPHHEGIAGAIGFDDPLQAHSPQPVFTGCTFYGGSTYPAYRGDLFACYWLAGDVRRIELDASGTNIVSDTPFAQHAHSFDLDSGPDGNLWVLHGTWSGGQEIGRYVSNSAPSPSLHSGPVSGPSLGGQLTLGVTGAPGQLTVPWVSFATYPNPVPTPIGPIRVMPEVGLSMQFLGADARSFTMLRLPNLPSLAGTDLHAQAVVLDIATVTFSTTNASTHTLR